MHYHELQLQGSCEENIFSGGGVVINQKQSRQRDFKLKSNEPLVLMYSRQKHYFKPDKGISEARDILCVLKIPFP
jgi:hypothetical protein